MYLINLGYKIINNFQIFGHGMLIKVNQGWQPHRDKVGGSLFENNEPKSVTVWIPLSVANPINSCMYVLPANKDKYYNKLKPSGGQISLPGSLADIKALPQIQVTF